MLSRVERRVFRMIFGSRHYENGLFVSAKDCPSRMEHPLRCMLLDRQSTRTNNLALRPPRAKTKHFASSFIRYCLLKPMFSVIVKFYIYRLFMSVLLIDDLFFAQSCDLFAEFCKKSVDYFT